MSMDNVSMDEVVLGRSDCCQQCDALGVARVRALLLTGDVPPAAEMASASWRHEAQQWLDERMRREGERAYAAVLSTIVLLAMAIVATAWLQWW